MQSTISSLLFWTYSLIWSTNLCLILQNYIFHSSFLIKISYAFIFFPIHPPFPCHPIHLDFIILLIFDEEYRLCVSSLWGVTLCQRRNLYAGVSRLFLTNTPHTHNQKLHMKPHLPRFYQNNTLLYCILSFHNS